MKCPKCDCEFYSTQMKVIYRRGVKLYDERAKERRGSGKGLHPSIWTSLGPPPERRKKDRRTCSERHMHMRSTDRDTTWDAKPWLHRRMGDRP
jgi:hypothetical protein